MRMKKWEWRGRKDVLRKEDRRDDEGERKR